MATPSLAMIPSGYKEEKLYSFLPVPSYSEELVTNGDFATDSDWNKYGSFTISGGVASASSNGALTQASIFQSNKRYTVSFDLISNGQQLNLWVNGTQLVFASSLNSGSYTYDVLATISGSLYFEATSSFIGSIDNVSVKEVLVSDGDFTFSRGSNATRVNKDGLIESMPLDYGSELITNGGFDTNNDWNNTNASVTNGVASFNAVSGQESALFQQNVATSIPSGTLHAFTYTVISNNLQGSGAFYVGYKTVNECIQESGIPTTVGTHTIYNNSIGTGTGFSLHTSVGFNSGSLVIDNISVKEVTGGYNKPRLDYSDSSCPSLLLEPQRTNLLTYSEDFVNSYWTKSGSSVVSGVVSPDGTNNAFKLVNNSSNGLHSLIGSNVSSSNTDYSLSLFVKAEEINKIGVRDAITGLYLTYDISTDTVIESNVASYNISKLTNGWNRVSIVFQGSGSAIIQPKIYLLNDSYVSGNPQTYSYTGNGTDGLYIWGAQLEEGSYSTSLIKTNGSSATRLQDECDNAGDSSTFNSEEGVLFAEISALADDGTYRLMSIEDASNSFIYLGYKDTSNVVRARMEVGGVTSFNMEYVLSDETEFNKVAVKWKVNDFALWVNGVEVETDTSGGSFNTDTLNKLSFNRNSSSSFLGKTKDLRVYNTALTDLELEGISSWESFIAMANGQNYTIK